MNPQGSLRVIVAIAIGFTLAIQAAGALAWVFLLWRSYRVLKDRISENPKIGPFTLSARTACLLLIPAVLLLIMQGFGIEATDKNYQPIFNFPHVLYWPTILFVIGLSAIAPFASIAAIWVAVKGRASQTRSGVAVLWALVLVGSVCFGTSFIGCAWTFSGHPTWGDGYAGRSSK